MSDAHPTAPRGTDGAAAALAALGALLLVLSDLAPLTDPDDLSWIEPLSGLFTANAAGMALLLSAVGFSTARAFLDSRRAGYGAVLRQAGWFVLLLWLLQVVVLAAVWLAYVVDDTVAEPPAGATVGDNAAQVLTFRWNLWVGDHLLLVRPELGTLTIFSLLVQLVVVLAALVVLLPRAGGDRLLGLLSAAGLVAVVVGRAATHEDHNPFVLVLHPLGRADAFLAGVLAACVVRWWSRRPAELAGAGSLAVVGGVLATSFLSLAQVFEWQLAWLAVWSGVALAGTGGVREGAQLLPRLSASGPITAVARAWAPAVAWSGPIGIVLARHMTETHWLLRLLVGVVALGALTRATTLVMRRPVGWLATEPARPTELTEGVREVVTEALERIAAGGSWRRRRDVARSGPEATTEEDVTP